MYQKLYKIQLISKPWHTKYLHSYKEYFLGDVIGYHWENWKIVDILIA